MLRINELKVGDKVQRHPGSYGSNTRIGTVVGFTKTMVQVEFTHFVGRFEPWKHEMRSPVKQTLLPSCLNRWTAENERGCLERQINKQAARVEQADREIRKIQESSQKDRDRLRKLMDELDEFDRENGTGPSDTEEETE